MLDTIIGITEGLIRTYPQVLGHIVLESLEFREDSRKGAPVFKIEGLNKNAIELLEETDVANRYLISYNEQKLEDCHLNKLQWLILETLLYVDEKCNGYVKKPDFLNHSTIVNAIGTLGLSANYLNHPALPLLLGGETPLTLF